MAAPHLKAPRSSIPTPVLRLRSKQRRLSVRAIRAVRGERPLAGEGRAPAADAASARDPRAIGAQVSADVHPVHPPEAVPPDSGRVRGVREHRAVRANRLPAHSRGQHAVQGVAGLTAKIKILQERPVDPTERGSPDERQMTSATDSLYGAVRTQTVITTTLAAVPALLPLADAVGERLHCVA